MSCRIILWSQSTRMLEFKHPMPCREKRDLCHWTFEKNYWTWQVSACRWTFFGWLAISVKPVCILIPSWLQAFKFAVKAINFEFEDVHTSTYEPNKFRIWRRPIINHARTSNIWTKEKHGFQWKFPLKYLIINDVYGMSTRWFRPGF